MAKSASASVHTQEKTALQASFPQVAQPTGLPAVQEKPKAADTVLAPGHAPEPHGTAGHGGGAVPGVGHQEAHGPVPGSHIPTAANPPKDDGGGHWWDWLTSRLRSFTSALPTTDPGLSTSAGPHPHVDTSGDANPAQTAQHLQDSSQEMTARRTQADTAVAADFGEHQVFPTVPVGTLRSAYTPASPKGASGEIAPSAPSLPGDVRAQYDQNASPALNAQVGEQLGKYRQEQAEYQQQSQKTREEGQQRITAETAQTRAQQQGIQQQVRGDVEAERRKWREENNKTAQEYSAKSTARRTEVDRQVQDKVQTADQAAAQKLTEAEAKADEERHRTEAQATEKKREVENKPHSFWDSVKDSISSVFDAVKSAVNHLFEGLRQLVKSIIEAAKTAVHALIDAARTVIVSLIKGFGEFVKALVSVALAAFPALAAKARAWIDAKVHAATEAVNRAAEALKKTADRVLDFVAISLDKALSLLQGAFNAILSGLEFLAKAPFEAMEQIAKLMEMIKHWGPFLEGLSKLQQSAGEIEAAAKTTIQGMIDQVPAKARALIDAAIQKVGKPLQKHLEGIWRHLEPGLMHLKAHWWDEIKTMVWNLVWPFNDKSPLWKDVPALIKLPGAALQNIFHGNISLAVDQIIEMQQKANGILGLFYGWFFIASVLVGTVIGAFFGGAGAIPGAGAGAAFAGEVGEGLLLATVAVETENIGKAAFDLAFGSGKAKDNENSYARIAGSGLTLGITGVMMILGEIAADLAKGIIDEVGALLKGESRGGPEVRVEVEGQGGKGEGPDGTGETNTPETNPGEPELKSEGPSEDGQRKVEVTKDGECVVCASPCEDIRLKYKEELGPDNEFTREIEGELDKAREIQDTNAQEAEYKRIEQKLADARKASRAAETPEVKAQRLKEARTESRSTIESIRSQLNDPKSPLTEAQKAEIREDFRKLDQDWQDTNKVAEDPDMQDLARDEFKSIEDRASQLEAKVQDTLPKTAEAPAFVRENRVPLDSETILSDSGTYSRTGKNIKGAQIYTDADGNFYHVDTLHTGPGAEIEFYDSTGNHLGTKNPVTGETNPGSQVKGRSLKRYLN